MFFITTRVLKFSKSLTERLTDFECKDKKISLGVHIQRTTPGRDPRKLGGYRFEYYWKDFKEFEDWNDVCKVLKEM